MKTDKFQIGQTFETTDWFSGGSHTHKIIDRTENKLICEAIYFELDGTHHVKDEYKILSDDNGEYIVVQSYKGEEDRIYAKNL